MGRHPRFADELTTLGMADVPSAVGRLLALLVHEAGEEESLSAALARVPAERLLAAIHPSPEGAAAWTA